MIKEQRCFDVLHEEMFRGRGETNEEHYATFLKSLVVEAIREAEYKHGGRCIQHRTRMIRLAEGNGGRLFYVDMMIDEEIKHLDNA